MVKGWLMDTGSFVGIERLHEVDLQGVGTRPQDQHLFVDILALTLKGLHRAEAKEVHP